VAFVIHVADLCSLNINFLLLISRVHDSAGRASLLTEASIMETPKA
jgi:hypothetical protein